LRVETIVKDNSVLLNPSQRDKKQWMAWGT
jgi:hypothetical protein